ncbi:MAG: class I SAM-dependent methyltransferase, partial [Dehalococcoidia bacterium]
MNLLHRWYCRSDGWAKIVQDYMLPNAFQGLDLGENALEIGPGPGRTTEWIHERVPALTAIEIDHDLAESLKTRMADTNVTVVEGDATKMPFPDASFTGAVCFTMLHHVPSAELQDRLLAET